MRSSILLVLGVVLLAPAVVTTAWAADATGAEALVEGSGSELAGPTDAAPDTPADPPDPAEPMVETVEPAIDAGVEEAPAAADADAAEDLGEAVPAAEEHAEAPEADDDGWLVETEPAPPVEDAAAPTDVPVEVSTSLGALGYDSEGHPGRIHVVVAGDTLWDISDAYLGTPWVWPSIWNDNREIENPNVIHPGDHIWITPTEMRRVSQREAEVLMAARPPAAPEEIDAEELLSPEVSEPVAEAPELAAPPDEPFTQMISVREGVGLITAETLAASASIVDSVAPRVMLGQQDEVYIGLGWDDVEVGDEFTIFRERERVVDPDTRRLLGYHVDILGWLKVKETYEETSLARIRESGAVMEKGDRLMVRERVPEEIAVQSPPEDVEGKLSFFARSRTIMAAIDYVYLNRGALDGLEVGSPLEVYRKGHLGREVTRGENVRVPERIVAQLVVVKAQPETAVAFVTSSDVELELGDRFRGATR
jgi:hypothetical protein